MTAKVVAFEEHAEVVPLWHRDGLHQATLVTADRHLDVKRISIPRLDRLDAAPDADALARLRRDPPMRDDDDIAYGSDDFLYAAGHLGMLERVVWVAPAPRRSTARDLGRLLWECLSFVPGHGQEVLDTFAVEGASAGARIGPLDVQCTTARLLPAVALPDTVRVDIDLDYFCGPAGRMAESGVESLVAAVRGLLAPGINVTAAYSTNTGHLPRHMRWVGGALASALERPLIHSSPRRTFAAPVGHGPELAERSLLALRRGDIDAAERLCDGAADAAEHPTCPAYELALHHMKRRDYARASHWLSQVLWTLADSVQGHALVLDALCAARCGDDERALTLARRCVDVLPLREEGYVLAARGERLLGRPDLAVRHERRLAEVIAIRAGDR